MAKSIFISFVIFLFASACAHTRVVKKVPGKSGEIMIQEGYFGSARADASKHMKANCGSKKPVITEEGEAVIGTKSTGKKDNYKGVIFESGETEDKREWRIKYRCK